MSAKEDATLVRSCLEGNNTAFETLIRKYEKPIYNLAFRMLRDRDDAQDITQTVFVKAYEKLDTFNPAHQFFSWIYRIAVNESINFSKKSKRMDEYESGVSASEPATQADAYSNDSLGEEIGEAIRLLKVDYRMVLVLKHYHDFSYHEMGEILDIPEKTVKSRLFSARQQLKEILSARGIQG